MTSFSNLAAPPQRRRARWAPFYVRTSPARGQGMVAVSITLTLMLSAAVALAWQLWQRAGDLQAREALTLQRMERIRAALCAYHRLNNGFSHLPGRDSPSNEPVNLPAGALPPLGWANPNGEPSASLQRLGLSPEEVTDGWGRLITVRLSDQCPSAPAQGRQVDLNGDGVGDLDAGALACVVLISHGRTGRGAALPQASATDQLVWLPAPVSGGSPAQGEGAEWRNTQRSPSAYQTVTPRCPTDNTNPDSPCHFDDIVIWFDTLTGGTQPLCR